MENVEYVFGTVLDLERTQKRKDMIPVFRWLITQQRKLNVKIIITCAWLEDEEGYKGHLFKLLLQCQGQKSYLQPEGSKNSGLRVCPEK